jgi:hypothetical protein
MSLTKLEVTTKCSPALVASHDEAAMATVINAGRTKTVKVPIADVQAYLQTHGLWGAIVTAAGNATHPAQAAAIAVVDASKARYDSLDTTLPVIGQMLGGLVATGVIAQANQNDIVAMSTVPDPVSAFEVAQALEGV